MEVFPVLIILLLAGAGFYVLLKKDKDEDKK